MLLVLPVHSSCPKIETLAKDLAKKGAYPEHVLRVITMREEEELGYQIGDELANAFPKGKVTTETLPMLNDSGRAFAAKNPAAFQTMLANQMFKRAMRFFEEYKYGEGEVEDAPMLYFHPLYRPTAQNWLNDLQAEFFLKGAPPVMARIDHVGVREDRAVKNPDVKLVTVGPVIFGRKCLGKMPLLNYLDPKEHWRSKMAHEIANGAVPTKTIGGGSKSILKEMPNVKVPA